MKNKTFISAKVRSVNSETFVIEHLVNTKDLDRYLTVVLPKGARVENYLNNPVVLWCHNMDDSTMKVPIGKCIELIKEDDFVRVKTEFNRNDPLAVKVFNAYKDGFLNSWSIGFIPEKYEKYTEENFEKLNTKYGLAVSEKEVKDAGCFGIYVVNQWELLEYSAVPVPGNPGATGNSFEDDKVEKFQAELVTRELVSKESAGNFRTYLEKECNEGTCKIEGRSMDVETKKSPEEIEAEVQKRLVEDKAKEDAKVEAKRVADEAQVLADAEKATIEARMTVLEKRQESDINAAIETITGALALIESQKKQLEERVAVAEKRIATELEKIIATIKSVEVKGAEDIEKINKAVTSIAKTLDEMSLDNIEEIKKIEKETKDEGSSSGNFFADMVRNAH